MKKRLSKILALLLVLTLVLTACGGKNNAEPNETDEPNGNGDSVEGLKGEISVQAEEAWIPYFEAAIDRVKENNPDVTINIIEKGSFDHLDIIDSTDATNPDVADVFPIPADRLYSLANSDVLASIDSKKLAEEIGGWDDFDGGLGGNLAIDGDYLAFPWNIETLIVFANTANAESEGIALDKPIDINTIEDPNHVLLPFFDAWYGVSLTNAGKIELLDFDEEGNLYSDLTKEYSELEDSQKAIIDGIYDYWKKHNENGSVLFDEEAGWGYIDDQFTTGNAGVFRLGGPWDASAMNEQAGEGNLKVYPIEQITIGEYPLNHWKGGWGLAINSRIEEDEDKMAIAYELIKELVNPEYAEDLYTYTGKILENVSRDTYEKSGLSDTDKAIVLAVIDSYEKAPLRPLFNEYGKVWDTWKNAILSWNNVKPETAEDAYKEIKASFDTMMTNF